MEIIRDEYISRGWSIATGEALLDVALPQWGRPREAEQYERVDEGGFPRMRLRVPVCIMPYDGALWRYQRSSFVDAHWTEGDGAPRPLDDE